MPETQIRRQASLAVQRRTSTPGTYDQAGRTFEMVAATQTPVRRYSWLNDGYYQEVLDFSPDAIDLGRVAAGQCPLLDTHSRYSISDQLGAVTTARVENNQLILAALFADTDAARQAEAAVAGGTLTGVSIGYRVNELTLTSKKDGEDPVYTATKWELLEVSLCPVPADPAAGVRSENGLHPCVIVETRIMPEINPAAAPATPEPQNRVDPAPAAPAPAPAPQPEASAARMTATEALAFAEDARTFGVDQALVTTWVGTMTPEAARSQLLRTAADAQRAAAPTTPAMSTARISRDERDTQRSAITSAIILRNDPKSDLQPEQLEQAREWRGMSLLEMVRYAEEQNGRKVRGLSKRELADLAFNRQESTSDFPNILANVANKSLRQAYESTNQTFKAWMRPTTLPDFKQVSRTQLGGAPSFLLVPEGGQFEMGVIGDGKEVYSLATYGRIFSVSRQTLINDDLGAFTRVPMLFGRAAADFESDTAYAPLITNPNMGDGVAIFASGHGNLAGSGAVPDATTVAAAELAMSKQTGLEGRLISAQPRWLITGVKDKNGAKQLVTNVQATATGNVNVYASAFDLVVEARLNRASGATPWFMAADCNQVDTFEYAYLEGEDGVYLEQRQGFEVDGLEFKARVDFATKCIDYRGVYENPGA